jgi:hypothetical protein
MKVPEKLILKEHEVGTGNWKFRCFKPKGRFRKKNRLVDGTLLKQVNIRNIRSNTDLASGSYQSMLFFYLNIPPGGSPRGSEPKARLNRVFVPPKT